MAVQLAVDQTAYRFRQDDGSESAASSYADANTPINVKNGYPVRLRVQLTTSGSSGWLSSRYRKLQAKVNAGAYFDVTSSSSSVALATSTKVTDETNTTQQLSSGGTFTAGNVLTTTTLTSNAIGTVASYIEDEWCIKTTGLSVGDVVTFQVVNDAGAACSTVTKTPTLTCTNFLTLQAKTALIGSSSSPSITVNSTVAGNFFIIGIATQGGASSISSVSDNQGGTWAAVGTAISSSGAKLRVFRQSGSGTKGGITTVTVTLSGTNTWTELIFKEITPGMTADDFWGYGNTGGGTTISDPTNQPYASNANEFCVSIAWASVASGSLTSSSAKDVVTLSGANGVLAMGAFQNSAVGYYTDTYTASGTSTYWGITSGPEIVGSSGGTGGGGGGGGSTQWPPMTMDGGLNLFMVG